MIQRRSVLILQFIYHSLIRSLQIIITIIVISIIIIIITNISISSINIISNEVLVPITSYSLSILIVWCAHYGERICVVSCVWVCVCVHSRREKNDNNNRPLYVLYAKKDRKKFNCHLGRPSVYTLSMYVRAVASWVFGRLCVGIFLLLQHSHHKHWIYV